MKNEDTIINNESTNIINEAPRNNVNGNHTENETITESDKESKSVATTSASGGKVIAGTLGGVLLGSVVSYAAFRSSLNEEEATSEEEVIATEEEVAGNEEVETYVPEWSNGGVSIATGVNDAMSFNEAFATARAEVGPGGAFEWNGNVYGTYYAEEWNSMTAQEKADYNNQFNWGAIDTTNNEQTAQEIEETAHVEPQPAETATTEEAETVEDYTAVPEIEVLGVVSDPESGNSVAPLIIDGEPVVLVDIDNDNTFDVVAADINDDLVLSEDEILDINEYQITVDDVMASIEDETSTTTDYDYNTSDDLDFTDSIDI